MLALGLLSLASTNMAAPLDARQDREGGADDTATKVKIMPFGASIVEIVSSLTSIFLFPPPTRHYTDPLSGV